MNSKIYRILYINPDGSREFLDFDTIDEMHDVLRTEENRCFIKEQTYNSVEKNTNNYSAIIDKTYKWKH